MKRVIDIIVMIYDDISFLGPITTFFFFFFVFLGQLFFPPFILNSTIISDPAQRNITKYELIDFILDNDETRKEEKEAE